MILNYIQVISSYKTIKLIYIDISIDNTRGELSNEELIKVEETKDLKKFPFDKIILMIISYIVMLFISFLKGSDYMKSIANVELYLYLIIKFLDVLLNIG